VFSNPSKLRKPLIKVRKQFKESSINFESDLMEAIDAAIETVIHNRLELETYIKLRPSFATALEPVTVDPGSPLIVRKMADAASKAGVGPMAAVAGGLADLAVEAMRNTGSRVSIVEDGGEVSAISEEPFIVGLYARRNTLGGELGFRIKPFDCPIGVATSSATASRAVSFGEADAATIFADNAAVADAAATAICNSVFGEDVEESLRRGLEAAKNMSFVRGAIIVRGDYVGSVGWIPALVKVDS
jgi:ApbE superfamily uncharacterized protein (UPF0280 family)